MRQRVGQVKLDGGITYCELVQLPVVQPHHKHVHVELKGHLSRLVLEGLVSSLIYVRFALGLVGAKAVGQDPL